MEENLSESGQGWATPDSGTLTANLSAELLDVLVKFKALEKSIAQAEIEIQLKQEDLESAGPRQIGRRCVDWWKDAQYVTKCDNYLQAFQVPVLRAVINSGLVTKHVRISWVDQTVYRKDELKYTREHEEQVLACFGDIGRVSIPRVEDNLRIAESTGVQMNAPSAGPPTHSYFNLQNYRTVLNYVNQIRDEAYDRIGNAMEKIAKDLTVTLEGKRKDLEQREFTYQSLLASKAQLLARIDDLSDRTGLDVKLLV
jgi:hypothetical protein